MSLLNFRIRNDNVITSVKIQNTLILPLNTSLPGPGSNQNVTGNVIFNDGDQTFYGYDGSIWVALSGGGGGTSLWTLSGVNYIQDTSVAGVDFDTNNLVFNSASTEGSGRRMMFVADGVTPTVGVGSFRVGQVTGDQWDAAKRGVNSFACGLDSTASGANSFCAGNGNSSLGVNAFCAGGSGCAANSINSFCGGGTDCGVGFQGCDNSAVVSGSNNNILTATECCIVTGNGNQINGGSVAITNNAILSGTSNQCLPATAPAVNNNSAVVSGNTNWVKGNNCSVVCGETNQAVNNTAPLLNAAVLSGNNNGVTSNNSAVVCGALNNVEINSPNSCIIAGNTNNIQAPNSAVLCGVGNTIAASANRSCILTGDGMVLDTAITAAAENFLVTRGTRFTSNITYTFADSPVTVDEGDQYIVVDTSAGVVVLSLHDPTSSLYRGLRLFIKRVGPNDVQINVSGGSLINDKSGANVATLTLTTNGEVVQLIDINPDGWYTF